MSYSTLSEVRTEAKRRGLRWAHVRDCYRLIKEQEAAKRQHANEVRQTAWYIVKARSPGCWSFWRVGFQHCFAEPVARGKDLTAIPGYDTIAQELTWQFPEYAGPDGTERLWDFLLSPYDRMPPTDELYRKALDLAERYPQETPNARACPEEF